MPEEQQQLEREIRSKNKVLRKSLDGGWECDSCAVSDGETESADGLGESQLDPQLQQLQNELALAHKRQDEAEAYCSQLQEDLRSVRAEA